jgi:nucleotide-binding universal stress UspA family protein
VTATTSTPTVTADPIAPAAVKPVLLVTINTSFDSAAVEFAVATAAGTGAELLICDAVPMVSGYPASSAARTFGDRIILDEAEAIAADARSRGVRTTQLLFHNPRPVAAISTVCVNQGVGLLVFGSDRSQMGRLRFRHTARRLRREAPCLVWAND